MLFLSFRNYTEVAFGLYGLQKYTADRWGMEAGVRFDGQQTKADGYDWTGRRYGGKRDFANFTYSLGGHYHINKQLKLTSHFGVAWRAHMSMSCIVMAMNLVLVSL